MAPTKAPTVTDLIKEAIENLKVKGSAKGVSRTAIKNYIGDRSTIARINLSLKRLVAKDELVQVKDSFKFNAKALAAKKKAATKKAAPKKKKTTTKKTTTTKPKKSAAAKKKKTTKKSTKKTTTKKGAKKSTKKTTKKSTKK
ncbi:hypothetical protein PTSG_01441 [Salpingoeca rosetta]|uniref:H15 domain-containing protein n=1 Tax=Salpingoeca rosetta (strain ATCC 50818 / BSB-021) TaxID=946362 RepID=F2U0C7_SALR5|nr:uncharacterized protein PTSG_01441 [Salpingoeca rosetta]EGD80855.1 hypothetical protein PTSG_01441 [Salpingoeca rosetta]|eukprot:XP_004997416.1 hypothetical protein PTSG_01441 [Salpingoeca rosetta]